MPPSLIAVINQSTLVTDTDVSLMTRACARQIRYDVGPTWSLTPAGVVFYYKPESVPPGAHTIAVVDTDPEGVADALGWHTEDAKGVYGIVSAKPVLDAGGKVHSGDWSLSSVLAHEIAEMFVDQSCRGWEASDDGYDYAREVGDPVEGPTYDIPVSGKDVSMCNFVLPSWFDNAADGPYDWMRKVTKPFELLSTGYVVKKQSGKERQVFGEEFPAWRRQMKASNPFSRTSIRTKWRP